MTSQLGSPAVSPASRRATWVKHAALDPFRGYANALRDGLSDAVAVLDAFYAEVLVMPMSPRNRLLGRRGAVARSA